MSTAPWVCGSCRSINQPRENRCYHCRTPRKLVEADPTTLTVAGVGSRPTEKAGPVGTYRRSGDRAFLAQLLIVAALGVTVVATLIGADVVGRVLVGEEGARESSGMTLALIGGLGLVLAAAALGAWAVWLSRVVDNVPAVGLGWPNVTPRQAVLESIIPGVNLYRVPAILRDIVTRLEPHGRGEALIAAAWLALFAGVLAPRLGRWAVAVALGTPGDAAGLLRVVEQLALGFTIAGGVLLIVLIQWIETRMERRAAAPQAEQASATSAPSS